MIAGLPIASLVRSSLPVARRVEASAIENGSPVTIDVAAVCDYVGLKSALTVTLDDTGTLGTVEVDGSNDVTYTPPVSGVGIDTFSYTIEDVNGTSNSADVQVLVSAAAITDPRTDAFSDAITAPGNPQVWYGFADESGETLADVLETYDATIVGTPSFLRPGLTTVVGDDRSIDFNSAAYAIRTHDAAFELANVTLTVIFKATQSDIDNGRYIVTKANAGEANEGFFGLRYIAGSDLRFWYQSDTSTFRFKAFGSAISVGTKITATLCFWDDGIHYYVDGELIGSDTDRTAGWTENTSDILIAADINNLSLRSGVTIDELFWHSGKLTLTQIRDIHEWVAPTVPEPEDSAWNDVGQVDIDGLTPARTVSVSNASALSSAMDAQAGDDIVLADGTYSGSWAITASGTQENPIVIRSGNAHGATITGSLNINGAWVIVSRLRVNGGINFAGADCRASRCYTKQFYAASPATRLCIDYNQMSGYTRGCWMRPTTNASAMNDIWIHHNYVINPESGTDDSAINFSGGAFEASPRNHNALIEYNLAEGCLSTTSIGSKASGATIQFNTVRNCPNGGFVLRHGTDGFLIGNASINSYGLQVYGRGHQVIGNYYDGAAGNWVDMGLQWGDMSSADWPDYPPHQYERAEDVICVGNVGALRIGGGSSTWDVVALNNEIWDHDGTITLVSGRHSGTVDNRGTPHPTITVPDYVVLQPSDVGPLADDTESVFARPFPGSAFKIRIGSGATFAAVPELAAHAGSGIYNGGNNNFAMWTAINDTSDPVRTISGTGIGLPLTGVRMPNNWPPILSGGEASILVDRDTLESHCFVGQTRNADGSVRSASIRRSSRIDESSHGTTLNYTRKGTSASGINNLDTALWWEWAQTPGFEIPQAIGLIFPRGDSGHTSPSVLGKGIQAPAGWVDYNAHLDGINTGPLKYGDRLGFPSTFDYVTAINALPNGSFNMPSFSKEAAIRIFRGLRIFGGIAVDGGAQANIRLSGRGTNEWLTTETAVVQFWNDQIYVMRQLMWQNLRRVSNAVTGATAVVSNSGGSQVFSGSIGALTDPAGGGTPLQLGDVY